jgi:hypothetical protein
MSHPTPTTPEAPYAAQTSYATPVRPPLPVTSPSVATNETPQTPAPIACPPEVPSAQGDTVAATVAGAMAAAEARYSSHLADTLGGAGRDIGTQLNLPRSPLDPAVGSLAGTYLRPDPGDEPPAS